MRYLTLREAQLEELTIAKEIDKFCNDNNICYYLFSGSLLGAVRHNGFIPWDDDMDIYMLRPDYDNFCKSFKSDKLIVKYCENGSLHAPFAKVCNPRIQVESDILSDDDNSLLWVDVFPVDGLPNNKYLRWLHLGHIRFIYSLIMIKRRPYSEPSSIIKRLIKPVVVRYIKAKPDNYPIKLAQKISKLSRKYSVDDYTLAGQTCFPYIYPIDIFKKRTKYRFEEYDFLSVEDYDTCLSCNYNKDYMTPPPESERISHHIKAYYKVSQN